MPAVDRVVRVMGKDRQLFYIRATYSEELWAWTATVREGDDPNGPVWEYWQQSYGTTQPATFHNPFDCLADAVRKLIHVVGVDTVP